MSAPSNPAGDPARNTATSVAGVAALTTEARNPRSTDLDRLSGLELVRLMNAEDANVAGAVQAALPQVAAAVDVVTAARRRGGRLVYLGAGTSGRLGVLDATECPPTFGTDPGEVVALIAGGAAAVTGAVEGAEDDAAAAAADLDRIALSELDVLVGLAASGRTPYVLAGLDHARAVGAATIAVSCNAGAEVSRHADVAIEVVTGPEVLTGSTRLKAGTAQKMVCNMLSTAAMVRTGKVYSNLMVDVRPTNAKLLDRARRIVTAATGADDAAASAALAAAHGHAGTAVVVLLTGVDAAGAARLLSDAGGDVRSAVAGARPATPG